jgi:hypothetical protein
MEVEELALPGRERPDVHCGGSNDPHPLQRRPVRDRRHDQVAVTLEPDESRSNRWSMLGIRRRPFSPLRRSGSWSHAMACSD